MFQVGWLAYLCWVILSPGEYDLGDFLIDPHCTENFGQVVAKVVPRISPVQEDKAAPARSVASPFGCELLGSGLGSSSSSLLEEAGGRYLAPPYTASPPRHGKLRPVGRTQSAPLPLGNPDLLTPPPPGSSVGGSPDPAGTR